MQILSSELALYGLASGFTWKQGGGGSLRSPHWQILEHVSVGRGEMRIIIVFDLEGYSVVVVAVRLDTDNRVALSRFLSFLPLRRSLWPSHVVSMETEVGSDGGRSSSFRTYTSARAFQQGQR